MKKTKCYENYPPWIVLVSNLVSLLIYAIGAFIIYEVGIIWLILYLLFILFLEIKLLMKSCVNCYYYGKYCAFGKGKISKLFFKKGNARKFMQKQITWKEIIPDFLVSVIPMIVGIILLIRKFNLLILVLVISLFLLSFSGNALVRGSLTCKYCKQREMGCPAEQLFNKKKK